LQVRQSIIANYSAFPLKGIDTYNELISNTAIIPSGIERFVPYCYRFMGLFPPNIVSHYWLYERIQKLRLI